MYSIETDPSYATMLSEYHDTNLFCASSNADFSHFGFHFGIMFTVGTDD